MDKEAQSKSRNRKTPYETPQLLKRQSLAETTATSKKEISNWRDPKAIGSCWVARAVYGETDPRWLLFRGWLLEDAPNWLRTVYIRHGERFARVVARQGWLASGIRFLMVRAIRAKYGT